MSIVDFKRLNKIAIIVLLLTGGLWGVIAQTVILSPVEGVWANYQSLVLNVPADCEVYYSLSGEDPRVSGFAYDGPVLISVADDVNVQLIIVSKNATIEEYLIDYTVNLQPSPSYIPNDGNEAVIKINTSQFIDIPQTALYNLGSETVFSSGRLLEISDDMLFERNVVLTLYDGSIPFRYVLQTGGNVAKIASEQLITEVEDNALSFAEEIPAVAQNSIEFTDWNYITFLDTGSIIYSIDDEPLRQTKSGKIFLDRTADHTLKWKNKDALDNTEFLTLFIPARPEIIGLPSRLAVNSAVHLNLSDDRYVFAWEPRMGEMGFTSTFTVDALPGDAFGFSENISIYYDGMKQGTITPVFIIDKILPTTPIITSSDVSGYAREPVMLTFQASDKLSYYIPAPLTSKEGFTSGQHRKALPPSPVSKEDFIPLNGNKLLLNYDDNNAVLYTVYVYASDLAGNTSDIVSYQTVVDPYNYYLMQNPPNHSYLQNGEKETPFTNFLQLASVFNRIEGQRFYIDGTFNDIPNLTINRRTSIFGNGVTRLVLGENASIQVNGTELLLKGCTVEQTYYTEDSIFQNSLIKAKNSTLIFSDCEFLLYGGNAASCLDLDTCSVDIIDSGITVQALVYGAGIIADESVVSARNLRSIVMAETAVGMSFTQTSSLITNSTFTILGQLGRGIEFIHSQFSLTNNVFAFENSLSGVQYQIEETSTAIWFDTQSKKNTILDNTYKGFSSLFAGL